MKQNRQNIRKKIIGFAVLFLAVFLLFCGCESKEKSVQNTKSNAPFETNETKNNQSLTDTVSIYSYKPDTLCPLLSENKANINVLRQIFDGLFSVDAHLNAAPALAESYDAFDKNTRYVITIKDGIYFHDGSKLSADDVVYSAKVIKENPQSIYYKNLAGVKSVKKTDRLHAEFVLEKADPLFVNLLDFPVIKNAGQMPDKESFVPIGTGAFKYENRNEGNLFYLVKNDSWWGGKVYPNSIRVKLLPDKDTALYAFSSGDISICPAEGDEWGKFVDSQNSGYIKYPTEYFYFLGFNNENQYLKNEDIRRGIALCLNRKEIFESAVVDFGSAANFALNKEWTFYWEEKQQSTDQKKARELFEQNGWEQKGGVYKKTEGRKTKSLKFSILVCSDSYKACQMAKMISENLTKFGIQTEVKKTDYEKYLAAVEKKSYDMVIGKILLPKNLNYSYFFEKENVFGISDEELLSAWEQFKLSEDAESLKENLKALKTVFEKKAPFAALGFEDGVMLVKNSIKSGLSPSSDNVYCGIEKVGSF